MSTYKILQLNMDDKQAIRRLKGGGLESFNCLVLACQDMVFQHAVWMLGELEAAEEITQETFLLAYRELHSFQNEDFCCWLLRIANQLCLDELHPRKSQLASLRKKINDKADVEIESGEKSGTGSTERNTSQDSPELTVQAGLMELSPDLRAVIILVDLQGFDNRQVADILRMPLETVKSRLTIARKQILDRLFLNAYLNGLPQCLVP